MKRTAVAIWVDEIGLRVEHVTDFQTAKDLLHQQDSEPYERFVVTGSGLSIFEVDDKKIENIKKGGKH